MVSVLKLFYYNVKQILFFKYYLFKNNNLKVSPRARLSYNSKFLGKISVGDNSTILENALFIGGEIQIGNNVIIAANCSILTTNHSIGKDIDALPYGTKYKSKKVVIEDNVWIGRNVSIAPGSIIREGAIVAMNSVVFGEIQALSVVYGNPATVKFYRDKDTYSLLKKNNLYLNDIRGKDYLNSSEKKDLNLKIKSFLNVKDSVYDYELMADPTKVRKVMYNYAKLNKLIFELDANKLNFVIRNEK